MEAGRELDALVAEKVMGQTNFEHDEIGETPAGEPQCWRCREIGTWGDSIFRDTKCIPHYSTDITAGWQVWNKISQNGWVIHKTITLGELSYFIFESSKTFEGYQFIGSGDTLPLAICSAALATVKQN